MKYRPAQFALALTFVLCGGASFFAQSPPGSKKARTPDDYHPRTLKEVAAGSRHDVEKSVILHGDVLPSRVRVTYKGSTRPLPTIRKDVLQQWAQRFAGSPEHYTAPYQTEVLFTEDGVEHWLAVKKNLISQFGKELKRGEAVDLFVIRLGGVRAGRGWEEVVLVESFRKPQ
ncbi:MAG: hypothetical protein LC803_11625 [Acidobacteria bacterium]|nr:hypothetical protein [Acidobacteriota bacterium]